MPVYQLKQKNNNKEYTTKSIGDLKIITILLNSMWKWKHIITLKDNTLIDKFYYLNKILLQVIFQFFLLVQAIKDGNYFKIYIIMLYLKYGHVKQLILLKYIENLCIHYLF